MKGFRNWVAHKMFPPITPTAKEIANGWKTLDNIARVRRQIERLKQR